MREPSDYTTTIDLGALGDAPVRIWYYFTLGSPGFVSGPPDACYPPEDDELEIVKIELLDGPRSWELPWDMLDEFTKSNLRQSIIEHEHNLRDEAWAEAELWRRGCEYEENWV